MIYVIDVVDRRNELLFSVILFYGSFGMICDFFRSMWNRKLVDFNFFIIKVDESGDFYSSWKMWRILYLSVIKYLCIF